MLNKCFRPDVESKTEPIGSYLGIIAGLPRSLVSRKRDRELDQYRLRGAAEIIPK
jgi:hypothetical protein